MRGVEKTSLLVITTWVGGLGSGGSESSLTLLR